MVEDYDVLIVGAGIGGLALGCALTSKGRKVCVLEARTGVTRSKRGLTLQPNGLAALRNMGLLDRVARIGSKTTKVAWHEIGKKPLATLDYTILDHPHNHLLTVVPSDLELVLREAFSSRGGIICESTSFRDILPNRSERVLVEAERNGSPVMFSVKEYADHFLFLLAGPVASLQFEARQYVDRGKMAGFFPTRDSTYIFYYLPNRTVAEFKSRGIESFKKQLADIEPDVSDSLSNLRSWEDVAGVSARRVDVKSWVADHAALLGDAVHALDPSWAQGANLSLQDALALANTIERCFELNDFTAAKLKDYEKDRRKQTEFVQNQAERTAQFTTTESRFYYWLGKRVLQRTGRSKTLMLTALEASCGLTDHFSLREKIRFII